MGGGEDSKSRLRHALLRVVFGLPRDFARPLYTCLSGVPRSSVLHLHRRDSGCEGHGLVRSSVPKAAGSRFLLLHAGGSRSEIWSTELECSRACCPLSFLRA